MAGSMDAAGQSLGEWSLVAAGGVGAFAIVAISIGILAAVWWTWRSLDPVISLRSRLMITGARLLALAACMGLFVQLSIRTQKTRILPARIAIAVDVSGSMSAYGKGVRLEKVRSLLAKARPALRRAAENYRISWYRFADKLVPADGPSAALNEIEGAAGTDIRKTLARLVDLEKGNRLAGVILISDGADTELKISETGWNIDWARELGVPINTVSIDDTTDRKDLAISQVKVDSFAFSRSDTPIVVSLSSVGLVDEKVDATLWQDGALVKKQTVQMMGGRGETTFTVSPSELGRHVMTLTVPTPQGDDLPENNIAYLSFQVIRDKYRILHLAGEPCWDQRFLRDALTSWPQIDLVSFYILRTPYQSSAFGTEGMALIPFPTKEIFEEHLNEFDILIFHNFSPSSVGVDRYLGMIADFVKNGGAIVLIGGENGIGGEIAAGETADLLPVVALPPGAARHSLSDSSQFKAKLTDEGALHPITRFDADPEKNAKLWDSLAPLNGIGRVARLSKGALRLVEHPALQADDGPAPVAATKEVGKGRSIAITTDSMWMWNFTGPMNGGPADAFTSFWKRVISWLTRDPELDRLRVRVNSSPVPVGKNARLEIELLDNSYRPVPGKRISCEISWIGADGVEKSDKFETRLDDRGRYVGDWLPKAHGPHRVDVTVEDGLFAHESFLVEAKDKELRKLNPDESLLKALSDETGGNHERGSFNPDSAKTNKVTATEVLERTDTPLWSRPEAILLFILLISLEWLLRRRAGLP